jgi:hypothetical protein
MINVVNEDITVIRNGDKYRITVGPILRRSKWKAGIFVKYVEDETATDEYTVERSDGVDVAGFLLYGSEDYTDPQISNYRNYTSYQNAGFLANANGSAVLTLISGGGRFLFSEFETISLDAGGVRQGPPIVYRLNEKLKISENGLLCNDPDDRLLLATGGDETVVIGNVCKIPSSIEPKLGFDMRY